ncbi:MAG TPA: L-serine ammonia-lyase, iron-sulfur-dependent subunit beta [Halanaerobiales bacterium]|nr:L-serine ammonia-lyase, iron-sulfur-dependent subunit beta [Halanaerobiales bacterium]
MSVFNVLGPIMIGPSSSHTAGAVKVGYLARSIFKGKLVKADIYLHGSFARTFKGHGTDRALVGGLLGFKPDDERIRDSLNLAKERGVEIELHLSDLRGVHPNTAKLELFGENKEMTIIGSSIGGSRIKIIQIDDYEVDFSGEMPTLWVLHKDEPGEIGIITSILGSYKLNIASMEVFRNKKGEVGSAIIELDHKVSDYVISHLQNMDNIYQVRYIEPF